MKKYDLGFGLGFNVEFARTQSGFRPARTYAGGGSPLFAAVRIRGFAAALELSFVERLIIIGATTVLKEDPERLVNEGWAIREMLIHEYSVNPARLDWRESANHTGGNIEVIRNEIRDIPNFAVVTNHYHVPRARFQMDRQNLSGTFVSAEALWLATAPSPEKRREWKCLLQRYFSSLPRRECDEINGVADLVMGTYRPLTEQSERFVEVV